MELKLNTIYGELTAVFESDMDEQFRTVYVAHIVEKSGIVVSAFSIEQAIKELHISLNELHAYETRL